MTQFTSHPGAALARVEKGEAVAVRKGRNAVAYLIPAGKPGAGTTRTIDLPIPWKVMDASSLTTNPPLASMTVTDTYVDPDTGSTYGTGNQIEVDTRYKIQTGFPTTETQTRDNNIVLSGDQASVVTTTNDRVRKPF